MDVYQAGIDHHSAPLEVRERLALDRDAAIEVARSIHAEGWVDEALVLATCNRTELYVVSRAPRAQEHVLAALLERMPEAPPPDAPCYRQQSGEAAARHLVRIACGLESAILGETEIQGQVRDAHERGLRANSVGAFLDRLLRTAIRAGKRARAETNISAGGLSHGSATLQVVRRVFDTFEDRRVLISGAGQIAAQAARSLSSLDQAAFVVANRTKANARAIANDLPNAEVAPLEDLPRHLSACHVAVFATGADPLSADDIKSALHKRRDPLLVVDLGLPRCVDARASELPGVFLYDLEALEAMVADALEVRRGAVIDVDAIIEGEFGRFQTWHRSLGALPAIRSLHEWAEAVRAEELSYLSDEWNDDQRRSLDHLTKRLVRRLLGRASARVARGAEQKDPDLPTPEHLRHLFGLDDDSGGTA